MRLLHISRQRGTVLIITLWTITLLTILVTVLAGQNRLSARAAQFHQEDLDNWANVLSALNQAEMEVMLDLMSAQIVDLGDQVENPVSPRYSKYRGGSLRLTYPQAEDVVVRIWDHAGKINLTEISRPRLRALLEFKLGDNAKPGQIDDLMAAWADWHDLNKQATPGGAEVDYYSELDLPYEPRNGRLETVEEILQIRGFAEVFADVDLDAAFTLFGENDLVNLNLATVETMRLLPGLNDELINEILVWREDHEFLGNGDVAQLVPATSMGELRPWLNSRRTSGHYSIMAYRRLTPDNTGDTGATADAELAAGAVVPDTTDAATTAYSEVVEISNFVTRPRVLKINPYQKLPIRTIGTTEEDRPQ